MTCAQLMRERQHWPVAAAAAAAGCCCYGGVCAKM